MQRRWMAALGGSVVAGGLLAATVVAPAGAQGPGPRAGQGPGPLGGEIAGVLQGVSGLLGMTPEALRDEVRGGRSLADVAETRGVDQATLTRAIMAAARTRLDAAVADGRLSAERADEMYQRIQQNVGNMITMTPSSAGPQGRGPRAAAGGEQGPGWRGFRGPDGSQGSRMRGQQGQGDGAIGMARRLGAPGEAARAAIAARLGMTPDELRAERRAGKSLAELAAARGVDQAALVAIITDSAKTRFDAAVADGRMTQTQANALLGVVQAFAPDMLTRTGPPPGRFGRDGQRQGPGQGQRRGPGGPSGPQTPASQ